MPKENDDIASVLLRWFLQVATLAAAMAFGTYSFLSWKESQIARIQAETANLLALIDLCFNGHVRGQ